MAFAGSRMEAGLNDFRMNYCENESSMLYEKLQEEIKKAMLSHDDLRRNCLRGLMSDVKNRTINEGKPVTDDAVAACAKKAAKMRRESIAQFEAAGQVCAAGREKAELECLSAFVPAQLSEEDTRRLVDEAIAAGAENVGAVMKALPGGADRKFAASYAKSAFGGGK